MTGDRDPLILVWVVHPVAFVGLWFAVVGVWPLFDPGHGFKPMQIADLAVHAAGAVVFLRNSLGVRSTRLSGADRWTFTLGRKL